MELAKITWDGRVTTVTLPEGVRLDGYAVRVRQEGGRIILEATPPPPSREAVLSWLDASHGGFDEDAARYALELREETRRAAHAPDRGVFD